MSTKLVGRLLLRLVLLLRLLSLNRDSVRLSDEEEGVLDCRNEGRGTGEGDGEVELCCAVGGARDGADGSGRTVDGRGVREAVSSFGGGGGGGGGVDVDVDEEESEEEAGRTAYSRNLL